jgi:hypothetical protein
VTAPVSTTMAPARATVCLLTHGDHLAYFRRALVSVEQHTPPQAIELRVGFNAAPGSFHFALGRLLPDHGEPVVETLEGGVERWSFTSGHGTVVRLWNSPTNLYKEPMCRLLYHSAPLPTEYAVWLDDDSHVQAGWWEALQPLFDERIDYLGQFWWVDYLPGQREMIQAQPWHRGVPFAARDGREGVEFATGGFMAVRVDRLCQANHPDTAAVWNDETLRQFGGDTLLGEIARQLGWSRKAHHRHVQINVDLQGRHPAPRRGGTGRQFGASVNVVIR